MGKYTIASLTNAGSFATAGGAAPPPSAGMATPSMSGLLGLIAGVESNHNPNILAVGGEANLTDMTIDEVRQLQRKIQDSGGASTAVGKYQIKDDTLDWVQQQLGLKGNERFTEELQDEMAKVLLGRRGLKDYQAGTLSDEQFMHELSKEWAALPKDASGVSYHAGTGNNRALVSPDETLKAMRSVRGEAPAAPAPVAAAPVAAAAVDTSLANASPKELVAALSKRRGGLAIDLQQVRKDAGPNRMLPTQQARGPYQGGLVARAWNRGASQTGGLFGQMLKLTGDTTGLGKLAEVGDDMVMQSFIEALGNPARFEGLGDLRFHNAGAFAAEKLAEQGINIGVALAGALVGSVAGTAAVGVGIGGAIGRAVFGKTATKAIARRAAARGAQAGTFAAFLPINTGEIIQEQMDAYESGEAPEAPELLASTLLGGTSTFLEVAGLSMILKGLLKDASKEVVEHSIRTTLRRTGKAYLKGLGTEAGTEGVQEVLVIASKKLNNPAFSITDAVTSSEGLSRILYASVVGGTVGGILGGAGGLVANTAARMRIGLERSRLDDVVTPGIEASENLFGSEDNQIEGFTTLFDFGKFGEEVGGIVSGVLERVNRVMSGLDNLETETEKSVGIASARQVLEEEIARIRGEKDNLDTVQESLLEHRALVAAAIEKLRDSLASRPKGTELNQQQNEAVHKAVKELNELLKRGNKRDAIQERGKVLIELLRVIQKLADKAMLDPLSVPTGKAISALERAKTYLRTAIMAKRVEANKYGKTLEKLEKQLQAALDKIPVVVPPEQATGAANERVLSPEETSSNRTEEGEILASLQAIVDKKSAKEKAYIIGYKMSQLPAAVRKFLGEHRDLVSSVDESGRIVVTKKGAQNPAETYATDVNELPDPQNTVVVEARNASGVLVQPEVVDKSPEAIRDAVARAEAIVPDGGSVWVGSPAEHHLNRVETKVKAAEKKKAAKSKPKKSTKAKPTGLKDFKDPNELVTIYRGESRENISGGEWWTTDPKKAAKFGKVRQVTLPAMTIAENAVQGHGGVDELVFYGKNPNVLVKEFNAQTAKKKKAAKEKSATKTPLQKAEEKKAAKKAAAAEETASEKYADEIARAHKEGKASITVLNGWERKVTMRTLGKENPDLSVTAQGQLITLRARKGKAAAKPKVEPTETSGGITFEEDTSSGYAARTRKNAAAADITIDFSRTETGSGGKNGLTKLATKEAGKIYINIRVDKDGKFSTKDALTAIGRAIRERQALGLLHRGKLSVNIAGHGVYSVGNNQAALDESVTKLLQQVHKYYPLKSVRSGGQTGFDEAGAKAGAALGIPTTVLAPKGYKFREKAGTDTSSETAFKARFQAKPKIVPDETPFEPTEQPKPKDSAVTEGVAKTLKDTILAPFRVTQRDVGKPLPQEATQGICDGTCGIVTGRLKKEGFAYGKGDIYAKSPLGDWLIGHVVALARINGETYIINQPQGEFMGSDFNIDNVWEDIFDPIKDKIKRAVPGFMMELYSIEGVPIKEMLKGKENIIDLELQGPTDVNQIENIRTYTENGETWHEANFIADKKSKIRWNEETEVIEFKSSQAPAVFTNENFTPRLIKVDAETLAKVYGTDIETAEENVASINRARLEPGKDIITDETPFEPTEQPKRSVVTAEQMDVKKSTGAHAQSFTGQTFSEAPEGSDATGPFTQLTPRSRTFEPALSKKSKARTGRVLSLLKEDMSVEDKQRLLDALRKASDPKVPYVERKTGAEGTRSDPVAVMAALVYGKNDLISLLQALAGVDWLPGLRAAMKAAGLNPYVASWHKPGHKAKYNVATIPDSLVVIPATEEHPAITWGEFKLMYKDAEYLAEVASNLDSGLLDPESREALTAEAARDVQDLEDFIQDSTSGALDVNEMFHMGILDPVKNRALEGDVYYAVAGNQRLIRVELTKDNQGNERIVLPGGAEAAGLLNMEDSKLKQKLNLTSSQGLFEGANEVVVVKHGGINVLKGVMPGDWPGLAVAVQVSKILKRGDETWELQKLRRKERASASNPQQETDAELQRLQAQSRYFIEAQRVTERDEKTGAVKKTTTVRMHLGEITELGRLINRGTEQKNTAFWHAKDNFIAGLNYLTATYDFVIDFRPNDIVFKDKDGKTKVIKGNKAHANKIIYGHTSYRNAPKPSAAHQNLEYIFAEHTKNSEAMDRWVEHVKKNVTRKHHLTGEVLPPTMQDVAEWLLDEVNKRHLGILERDFEDPTSGKQYSMLGIVLKEYGLIDTDFLKTAETLDMDTKTIFDGLQLTGTVIRGTKTRREVGERKSYSSKHRLDRLFSFRNRKDDRVFIDEDGIMFRDTAEVEYTEPRDITDETQMLESTVLEAEPESGVIQVHKGRAKPKQVVNRMSTPSSAGNVLWTAAHKAVELTLKLLNIKENVVLFDETSVDSLITQYKVLRDFELKAARTKGFMYNLTKSAGKEKERMQHIRAARMYDGYIARLEAVKIDKPIGRIITPHGAAKYKIDIPEPGSSARVVHIFVSNEWQARQKKGKKTSRGAVLMHEIGHLVQFTYLDALPKHLQKKVLDAMSDSNKLEAFANWMSVEAARMGEEEVSQLLDYNKKVEHGRLSDEFEGIFSQLLKDLRRIWTEIKDILNYKPGFADFVAAMNTHARIMRGDMAKPFARYVPPKNLTTPLARQIFVALQDAQAGPYIATTGINAAGVSPNTNHVANYTPPSAQQTAARARSTFFQNYLQDWKNLAERFKADPKAAVFSVLGTADAELRAMGLADVADEFRPRVGSTSRKIGLFTQIRMMMSPHLNGKKDAQGKTIRMGLNELLKTLPKDKASLQAITDVLLKHKSLTEVAPEHRKTVAQIRQYLNYLYNWHNRNTMGKPIERRANYFPLTVATDQILARWQQFEQILMDNKFSAQEATEIRKSLTRDPSGLANSMIEPDERMDTFLGPGARMKMERVWDNKLRDQLIDAGFYRQDIGTTLQAYTDMITRRIAWERRFSETDKSYGNLKRYEARGVNIHSPIAKLLMSIEEAGLNEWQRQRVMNDILPAYSGQLGLAVNPHLRKLGAWVVIYQNIRLLSMAVLSSVVDVGTLMLRAAPDGRLGEDWAASSRAAWHLVLDKQSREQAKEMLMAIGAMRQHVTEHVLNDQGLNTFMTGRAKWLNDQFFHWNQMERWTNMMRAMALASGREFIQRNARKAIKGDAKATQFLAELSLTPKEAQTWVITGTMNERIAYALNRYIDEAMIRPDPAIRPVYMSDPGYTVFSHLKGFMYGFHETFLRRVGHEFMVNKNLMPMMMLGLMALPFAAIGYEVRKKLSGSKTELDGMEYAKELFERSGMAGPYQMILDMEQADAYGKPFLLGISGPAIEQLYDFLTTNDLDMTLARSIPIVAQSPPMRQWVADTLE